MNGSGSLTPRNAPSQPASPRGSTRSIKAPPIAVNNNLEAQHAKEAKEIGVPYQYFQEMKEIFKIFDADGSGAIDPKEIREQMISLGFQVDNTTIYQLISDLDSDGSQKIEFGEFLGVLKDQLQIHSSEFHTRQNIKETFDFLDDLDPKNRDGRIDVSNLRRLATVLADDIPERELEVMVRGADKDGKGYVSPEDFYELMVGCALKMELQEEEFQRSLLEEPSPDDYGPEPLSPLSPAMRSSEKGKRSNARRSLGSSKTRERLDSVQMDEAPRKSRGERSLQSSRAASPLTLGAEKSGKDAGLGVFRVDRSGSVTKYNSNPLPIITSDVAPDVAAGGELASDRSGSDTLSPSKSSLNVPQQVVRQPSKQSKPRYAGARKNLSLVPEDEDDEQSKAPATR
mmetsp:Transcript_107533/g.195599  ORF Transcript_107533/g.195599 Transcript_107533/m.195599 type:complete len:399 (+) Transcript_107533:115-1311(+)